VQDERLGLPDHECPALLLHLSTTSLELKTEKERAMLRFPPPVGGASTARKSSEHLTYRVRKAGQDCVMSGLYKRAVNEHHGLSLAKGIKNLIMAVPSSSLLPRSHIENRYMFVKGCGNGLTFCASVFRDFKSDHFLNLRLALLLVFGQKMRSYWDMIVEEYAAEKRTFDTNEKDVNMNTSDKRCTVARAFAPTIHDHTRTHKELLGLSLVSLLHTTTRM
jgi:hypothetical protein